MNMNEWTIQLALQMDKVPIEMVITIPVLSFPGQTKNLAKNEGFGIQPWESQTVWMTPARIGI